MVATIQIFLLQIGRRGEQPQKGCAGSALSEMCLPPGVVNWLHAWHILFNVQTCFYFSKCLQHFPYSDVTKLRELMLIVQMFIMADYCVQTARAVIIKFSLFCVNKVSVVFVCYSFSNHCSIPVSYTHLHHVTIQHYSQLVKERKTGIRQKHVQLVHKLH